MRYVCVQVAVVELFRQIALLPIDIAGWGAIAEGMIFAVLLSSCHSSDYQCDTAYCIVEERIVHACASFCASW